MDITADDEGHVMMVEPSNKLDALMDIVEEADGASVVVFSQFRQLIELASSRLTASNIDHYTFTGRTKQEDRRGAIAGFQKGERSVFLATTQSGGQSITLTKASTCVFLDRAWSPAMNEQAEDRLHRIGQPNAVEVIVLQSEGTVDLTVEKRLELKKSWVKSIIGS